MCFIYQCVISLTLPATYELSVIIPILQIKKQLSFRKFK